MMNKWKKAKELAELILEFGKGDITEDEAELYAYRYYSNTSFWDMIRPKHTSMSQLANNIVIGERLSRGISLN